MINEGIVEDLLHAARLEPKQRGELAELAFMHDATLRGFAVAKPWGENNRYDLVVRSDKSFVRVQVKSVFAIEPATRHYRVKTATHASRSYSPEEIDFLVAYIFAIRAWYILPASIIGERKTICIIPGCKKSKYERYREAWGLMQAKIL